MGEWDIILTLEEISVLLGTYYMLSFLNGFPQKQIVESAIIEYRTHSARGIKASHYIPVPKAARLGLQYGNKTLWLYITLPFISIFDLHKKLCDVDETKQPISVPLYLTWRVKWLTWSKEGMNCSKIHIFLSLISSFYIFLSFWLNTNLSQMSPCYTT